MTTAQTVGLAEVFRADPDTLVTLAQTAGHYQAAGLTLTKLIDGDRSPGVIAKAKRVSAWLLTAGQNLQSANEASADYLTEIGAQPGDDEFDDDFGDFDDDELDEDDEYDD